MQNPSKRVTTTSITPPASKILGKNLPAHITAERALLSAVLLQDDCFIKLVEVLTAEDFFHPAHRSIYSAMQQLYAQKKRIDLLTLQDELQKAHELETIGGVEFLVGLQEDFPSLGLIDQHVQLVKEKAVLRKLIEVSASIISKCYNQERQTLESILDTAEMSIFEVSKHRQTTGFVQLDIWLKRTFQQLSSMQGYERGITGVPSGLKKLDEMTSGFQAGDLIVLAARPSMGKTGLALCMAQYAAFQDYCVGIFSLEMSAEQLTLRLLSAQAQVPHHLIRNATISSQDWVTLTNVAGQLASKKIFIDDTAMLTIMDLRAKARKLKAEHNVQFIVVDYLQLLAGSRRHENRHQEVSEISRSLKALAKELNIPILALSQLSRAVDSRVDKRPMLSDLRESGAIEQDADLIMFLYREVMYNPDTENPGRAELIIGKQRNGPTGMVPLHFVRELTKFESSDDDL